MKKRILIVNGHPDPAPERFCTALAGAYEKGAHSAGHQLRLLNIGTLAFNMLHTAAEFAENPHSTDIIGARGDMLWAEHLVFIFPLWLGGPPALLKAFMECVGCGEFLLGSGKGVMPQGKLHGRTARILVTMGMPSLIYRTFFLRHGTKAFERGILNLAGVRPVRTSYMGGVETSLDKRRNWLAHVHALGAGAR
jgi:putative NADPH-quinone reductase